MGKVNILGNFNAIIWFLKYNMSQKSKCLENDKGRRLAVAATISHLGAFLIQEEARLAAMVKGI